MIARCMCFRDVLRGIVRILGLFSTKQLKYPFPGTVVVLELNTADVGIYQLTSEEIDPEDIF